ncbi:MAG: FecR domain-containing protein, partial [Vicinamibacteria bacterium]
MRFEGLILSSVFLFSTLSQASPASGQDYSYRYAFVSRVEGEVSLQRASEPEPEEGASNVPILPGDRLWTLGGSRAEVRFADGSALRLSEGAKVDFVDLDSETILRVWSGSIILELSEARDSLRIDSPAGTIRPTREGSYRIDVEDGDAVTLFVPRGSAELANSRGTVLVQSGETSYAALSEPPQIPVQFNTASLDDFARWSESLDREASGAREVIVRSLPHEVRTYADDLERHGDWDYDADYG